MELARLVLKLVADAGQALSTVEQFGSSVLGGLGKMGSKFLAFGSLVAGAMIGVGALSGAFNTLGDNTVGAAVSMESAFAGIIKTTDGLVDGAGKITNFGEEIQSQFREMATDIPMSVEGLMDIGALAGQLGVPEKQLASFTETIAALGVSTNMMTETAATEFAKMANIFQASDIADFTARTGASVVELGNNFATTESDIMNFAERIAGAGKIAGLLPSDVTGIGAAMSSVGVEAEAGGTAVQKVLLSMTEAVTRGNTDLTKYAKTAGMTRDEFVQAFQTDAAGAFTAFVEGLGSQGNQAMTTLSDLGLEDQRLMRSFLSLAGAGDLLSKAIGMSSQAFEENSALTEEAARRYATTASQWTMFQNLLKDFGISIGGLVLPLLIQLIQWAKPLVEEYGQKAVDAFKNLIPKIQELGTSIGTFVTETLIPFVQEHGPELAGAFTAIGAVLAGAGIIAAIVGIVSALNPVTLAIMAIIALAGLFGAAWAGNWGGIQEKVAEVWAVIQPVFQEIWNWLQTNIPVAVQTLVMFWEGTLLPALMNVWTWMSTVLWPFLVEFGTFIGAGFGAAIQVLANIWNGVLMPVLQAVWAFLSTVLMPILSSIGAVIGAVINGALSVMATLWTTTVMPAIQTVIDFLATSVFPIFEAVGNLISTVLNIALTAMAGIWENVVLPALQGVADTIKKGVQPVIEAIGNFINGTLNPAVKTAADFFGNLLKGALDGLSGTLQGVSDWINTIADSLKNITLPTWMTPGSPTPWEIGLWGVLDAMKDLNRTGLPVLETRLNALPEPVLANGASGYGYGRTDSSQQTKVFEAGSIVINDKTTGEQLLAWLKGELDDESSLAAA